MLFGMLRRLTHHWFTSQHRKSVPPGTSDDLRLYANAETNVQYIRDLLRHPVDLVVRRFPLTSNSALTILYMEGLADTERIEQFVLEPLKDYALHGHFRHNAAGLAEQLPELLAAGQVSRESCLPQLVNKLLSGSCLLFADGWTGAMVADFKGGPYRSVDEPASEAMIRGPRTGFIENITTNIALLRRIVVDPNLRLDSYVIGKRSKTRVVLAYVDGVVPPDLVAEVKRRLDSFSLDTVPESGAIEQLIQDSFLSPFPQIRHTERPDKVSANLYQGKVAIFIDGTPFVLLLPITFGSELHSTEDYNERWMISTLIRILRYICAFIAVFLPGLYIALVEYHPGMIPSKLAFSIAGAREGVPFPAVVEAFFMEVTLEILREAGVRMPKQLGQTIGIVGGLVIGEAAVMAGVVSPFMVIIVAVTAISTFALPNYSFGISLRIIRFAVMIGAAIFGFYGLVLVYIMVNIHVTNLKSFGLPYTAPFSPTFPGDWKDLVLRAPYTTMQERPDMNNTADKVKQKTNKGEKQ
ncbi:spore germination protein [Xylanibacillus composti]|nr:spore germination protein [Xylanibacillus composti]